MIMYMFNTCIVYVYTVLVHLVNICEDKLMYTACTCIHVCDVCLLGARDICHVFCTIHRLVCYAIPLVCFYL